MMSVEKKKEVAQKSHIAYPTLILLLLVVGFSFVVVAFDRNYRNMENFEFRWR
jgi:hypothetical protein